MISATGAKWQANRNRTSSSKKPLGTGASSAAKGTIAGGAGANTTSKAAAAKATGSVSFTSLLGTLIEHNSKDSFVIKSY